MAKFKYQAKVERKSYLDMPGGSSMENLLGELTRNIKSGEGGFQVSYNTSVSKANTKILYKQKFYGGDSSSWMVRGEFYNTNEGSYAGIIKSIKSKSIKLDTQIKMSLTDLNLNTDDFINLSHDNLLGKIFKGDDTFIFTANNKEFYKEIYQSPAYGHRSDTHKIISMGSGNDKLIAKGPIVFPGRQISTGSGKDEIILMSTKQGQPSGLSLTDIDRTDTINLKKIKVFEESQLCSYSSTRWNVIAGTKDLEQVLISTGGVECEDANVIV